MKWHETFKKHIFYILFWKHDNKKDLPLEPASLNLQQLLDVCTACEDSLQVNPSPLYIYPYIKQGVDAVQLVFPCWNNEKATMKFCIYTAT